MPYKDRPSIAIKFYRIERFFYLHKMRLIAQFVYHMMQLVLGCTIPYSADLGGGVNIAHFHGIVIHHKSSIGENTVIYQNVTLGGRNGKPGPRVGKNCVIGAGACILGDIEIGNNVNIGANAVVLENIPDNCTAVGVPARIIKHNEK